jgi:TolB protein
VVRYLFPLAGILFLWIGPLQSACPDKDWQLYTDHVYRLTLCIPPGWRQSPIYSDRAYFEGSDGRFQFDASEGHIPLQSCEGSATHVLHPYGSHPQIRSLKIDGQKACLVWPSEDQGAQGDAELQIQYPRPIRIVTPIDQPAPVKSIEGMYGLLVFIADKNHILEIAKTIKFQISK